MKRLKERYRYPIILLKQLVIVDFKLRYQGSFLGYLWSLLRPLALFSILYVVFVQFLRFGDEVPHFATYLLLGIVLWNFFSDITNGSVSAIVGKGELLRKINFPRYIIIVASSVSALINLGFNLLVVGLFMYLQGVDIGFSIILALILILELFILSLGLGFLLSALYVKFRDINYIWEVVLQAGFYATPIIYPFRLVLDQSMMATKVLALNPLAQIIQDTRYLVITSETLVIEDLFHSNIYRLIPVGIVIILFIVSALYFRSRSPYFAENV